MKTSHQKRFKEAISIFNNGEFYKCHDLLEDIWYEVRDDSRNFYQGLIHLAVGLHHLTVKKNVTGGIAQLDKAVKKLTPYRPQFEGVELEKIITKIKRIIAAIKKDNNYKLKSLPKIILSSL